MRNVKHYTIMKNKSTNGVGLTIPVRDWTNCDVCIAAPTSARAVAFCRGAVMGDDSDISPDFSAAATITNRWSPLQVVDLDNGSDINGSTGITIAPVSSDFVRTYEVNIDSVDFITFALSDVTAGSVTITITCTDNE